MKAVWYEALGAAHDVLQLGDQPDPAPGPGEVLVEVRASGVNPSDVKQRAGARGPMPWRRIIPHNDGAGVITAVGAGVDPARLGERVWLWNTARAAGRGTCAALTATPQDQAAPLPETTSFAGGACLGVPAMTAHRAVFADGPVAGLDVLVTGGAGAVGHFAIQLAKRGGARVITTVSGPDKAAHAAAAGADHVVNYREVDVADAVRGITGGAGVDRIVEVEFGGNLAASDAILKPGGVIAAYGSEADANPRLPFYPLMMRNAVVRTIFVYDMPPAAKRAAVDDLEAAMAEGALTCAVARTYPLAQAADAHASVEAGGVIGGVVVEIA